MKYEWCNIPSYNNVRVSTMFCLSPQCLNHLAARQLRFVNIPFFLSFFTFYIILYLLLCELYCISMCLHPIGGYDNLDRPIECTKY